MQEQYCLFAGKDRVGVLPQRIPILLHCSHFGLQRFRYRRQSDALITNREVAPTLAKVVASIFQRVECLGGTGGRLNRVLRDALGENSQLTCVSNVFVIVVGLCIDVREVHEQQHHRDD